MKIIGTSVVVLALVVALAVPALAGGRDLKKLGLKAYWSVLDEGQRVEAKALLASHLSETAADRLTAASRFLEFRAEVAKVLTPEQRIGAMKLSRALKGLTGERKKNVWNRLLERTDRVALADLVERFSSAGAADRVTLGYEILDQLFDVLIGACSEKLGLSADQQERIQTLFEEMKTDLRPVAERLAEARAGITRQAISLLRPEQREKLDKFREAILAKVTGFLRG